MLNHPHISRINPTWSWIILFNMLLHILVRISAFENKLNLEVFFFLSFRYQCHVHFIKKKKLETFPSFYVFWDVKNNIEMAYPWVLVNSAMKPSNLMLWGKLNSYNLSCFLYGNGLFQFSVSLGANFMHFPRKLLISYKFESLFIHRYLK